LEFLIEWYLELDPKAAGVKGRCLPGAIMWQLGPLGLEYLSAKDDPRNNIS
jgi:hypothetical protein